MLLLWLDATGREADTMRSLSMYAVVILASLTFVVSVSLLQTQLFETNQAQSGSRAP
jgi:hypothetical protein